MSLIVQNQHRCTPHYTAVRAGKPLAGLSEVISKKTCPAILGGNDSVQGQSIFTAEPVEVFEFKLKDENPFEKLTETLSKYQSASINKSNAIFSGGWIGFFGYELGRFIEKLPDTAQADLTFPLIRLAFYDKAVIYDHADRQYYLAALEYDGQPKTLDEKFTTLKDWLAEARQTFVPNPPMADIESIMTDTLQSNITQPQYMDAIGKIKRYIYDGDTYQINFSRRFSADFRARSIDLFHWQNRYNPSPFSAYLAWGDKAVVSASPELFLQVCGNTIQTRPIKGTRPRNPLAPDDAPENRAHFHDLVQSEKEQAELAMIVDLERNDLARICIPGTRHVTCARQIETFPTVYHAVAVIEGMLKTPPGPHRIIDIIKAAFPGGSITGAPKIRSMEIIDELEPAARSIYTGAIGWIGTDFNLCWNIAIRTILIENQKAYVQTGGGIVADSDPTEEWNEILTKARALLAGIQAVNK